MASTDNGIHRAILSFITIGGMWLVLCDGNLSSLGIGLPVIGLAMLLRRSPMKDDSASLRPLRLIGFVPFFLKESLRGGIDAASRAFAAKPRLSCGTISFETSLPQGAGRVFFASVVGLLPGTLTTLITEDSLFVHGLDTSKELERELRMLERKVAYLFGICLAE